MASERPNFEEVIAANLNLVNPLRNIFGELDPACEVVDALEVLLAQEAEHLAAVLNAEVDRWLADEGTRERVAAKDTADELWRVFLRLPHTPSPLGDYIQRRVEHFRALATPTVPTTEEGE